MTLDVSREHMSLEMGIKKGKGEADGGQTRTKILGGFAILKVLARFKSRVEVFKWQWTYNKADGLYENLEYVSMTIAK